MPRLKDLCDYLDHFAPPLLAEEWDNVGLLAGDPQLPVHRVMTCLTITPQSAEESIRRHADLVVTHHPLPFRAIKRLVTTTTPGRLLWELLTHRVAIYSPHTAFDSTAAGINQRLSEGLGLQRHRAIGADRRCPGGNWGRDGLDAWRMPCRWLS